MQESLRAERRGRTSEALALTLEVLLRLDRQTVQSEATGAADPLELHAMASLVRLGGQQDWQWLDTAGRELALADGSRIVVRHEHEPGNPATLDPRDWDLAVPAAQVAARELPDRNATGGDGVPFVFSRDTGGGVALLLFRREREVLPATALSRVERAPDGRPELVLRWQSTLESVEWSADGNGPPRPVAADFSAPLEVFGSAGGFRAPALMGILRPDRFPDSIELFRMTPDNPDRIPVVLVHGLASQPRMWRSVVNELLRDPLIREHCEFYYFAYPTSQPLPYAASELRRALAELEDSGLADDGDVLLVGHSLGGLVSKLQVVDSENALWDLYFRAPPEDLGRLGPVSERLSEWLLVTPAPAVGRVVFIATPHGGSEIADSWIGNIGRRLARVPRGALSMAAALLTLDVDDFTDNGRRVLHRFPTVVETLSVHSEFLHGLHGLPVHEGIGTHTIYGNRHAGNAGRPCTDGVVRCDSARLPEVDSERMVVSGHNAHENPEAIAELARIIRLHLHERGRTQ